MNENYSYEINFWRLLAGVLFAVTAVFSRLFLPTQLFFAVFFSAFFLFLWLAFGYIPLYYSVFSYEQNEDYIKLTKGVFVTRQTVINKKHLSAKTVLKPFPLNILGLKVTVFHCQGAIFTLPLTRG